MLRIRIAVRRIGGYCRGEAVRWMTSLMLALAGSGLIGTAASGADQHHAVASPLADSPLRHDQIGSTSQFSDLRPTDWAYQALSDLIERVGCVAGHPDGLYGGGQTISRFEAAALLNACLERVSEVTDTLSRLIAAFEPELAVLRGRVDGLEGRIRTLEAQQVSATTKLSGLATVVMGGVSHHPAGGRVTVNYDLQLNIDTSFTGKDLLRTVLRAGNFDTAGNAFNRGLSTLETAFQLDAGPDLMGVDRLFYRFPLGNGVTATLGGRVGQEDMLALWPSVYPSSTVLNLLNLAGAPLANNQNLGPGFGLWWQASGWSVSANVVAANGSTSSQGLFGGDSATTSTVQFGYGRDNWGIAAMYSAIDGGVEVPGGTPFVTRQIESDGSRTNAVGISGFWQPVASGWIPSISAGYGINGSDAGDLRISQSWMVGLQWSDVPAKGSSFGMGFGQPAFATATRNGAATENGVWAWEWWVRWQLSDQISLTPAIFFLDHPNGSGRDQLGALLKTSFAF